MSLLGKLFGRKSAAEEKVRADGLFERGEHGDAKLAYERAIDAATDAEAGLCDVCRARVIECCDAIARKRVAEAERLAKQGAEELALSELEHALQTAKSEALLAEIEQKMEALVRKEAREHAIADQRELDDDERFELIAGSFEAEQYAEYAEGGDGVRRALLALSTGDGATALPLLEEAAKQAKSPCYLWLEVGRARLLCGDTPGGRGAIEAFLSKLEPEEGGDARLSAHIELAGIIHEAGDVEGAIAQYQAALEALPDDPRPYLALARFLRRVELPEEALEILSSALTALDADKPVLAIVIEQGLAHAQAGDAPAAIEKLEKAVSMLTAMQHRDLPPELATKLAELHERGGNKGRALDLYALLADGSDVVNRGSYLRHMGRLLAELSHPTEAKRALQRALELAPADSPQRAEIAEAIAAIR
jgi:tetratricopeptide (TPR) repeat protein